MNIKCENNISYKIDIGYNITNNILNDISNYFICIDRNVLIKHGRALNQIIDSAIDTYILEATESNKTLETVHDIHSMLFKNGATRFNTIISIGGGVCGDVCGYSAATFKRGMKYIQIPTTLLSQVDSSIGNKVGVNAFEQKNSIGTFYAPSRVIIDTKFLTTNTTRVFREGLVEMIKHGLIGNMKIITLLENTNLEQLRSDQLVLQQLINLSLIVKKSIVESDPLDTGSRHLLNFGHTLAHSIELNNDLYHGECVCWGILVNTYNTSFYERIKLLFEKYGCIKEISNFNIDHIKNDKKRDNNIINEIFLDDLVAPYIKKVEIEELQDLYEDNYYQIKDEVIITESLFEFKPSKLSGKVLIPPSKSALHRYIIAAALSGERTVLKNVYSIYTDVKVTMNAIELLNAKATYKNNEIIIEPVIAHNIDSVDMNESGTSLRIMLPLLMHFNAHITVTGQSKLPKRPMEIYYSIFKDQGIEFYHNEDSYLPLTVNGALRPDTFNIPGDVSSQFISGLLFTLPLLKGKSTINLTSNIQSLPYVLMTLKTLNDFGIKIDVNNDYSTFTIEGDQKYLTKHTYTIEQDYSSRSFFEVANKFSNNSIEIINTIEDTLQGDIEIINILQEGINTVDLTDFPDLAPILAVYFSTMSGTLKNTIRLKYKESNRLKAIMDMLNTANIKNIKMYDKLFIHKGIFESGIYDTYKDHRIAMSLIIASTIASGPIYLREISSIDKSFTTFIEIYEQLGGNMDEK